MRRKIYIRLYQDMTHTHTHTKCGEHECREERDCNRYRLFKSLERDQRRRRPVICSSCVKTTACCVNISPNATSPGAQHTGCSPFSVRPFDPLRDTSTLKWSRPERNDVMRKDLFLFQFERCSVLPTRATLGGIVQRHFCRLPFLRIFNVESTHEPFSSCFTCCL